jgi:hypothetical protein
MMMAATAVTMAEVAAAAAMTAPMTHLRLVLRRSFSAASSAAGPPVPR